ncbi:MAG TPA: hypothetical protein VGE77_08055 [Nocardioides sp.]
MTIGRVTQGMLSQRAVGGLQTNLARLAEIQEKLSTGRSINRASDSPTDSTAAMRLTSAVGDAKQHSRNAADALGWLGITDTALQSVSAQLRRASDLAIQGGNAGALSADSREAIAVELEQIRDGLIGVANTQYLDRPVFGGITAGSAAYDASGAFVGEAGAVNRTVGAGAQVRVDVLGPEVFGPAGDTVFDRLTALAGALRSGDTAGVRTGMDEVKASLGRVTGALAEVGTRTNRVESAQRRADDAVITLGSAFKDVAGVDIAATVVDLQMQEVAYQAALGAAARVIQPSLMDFLR